MSLALSLCFWQLLSVVREVRKYVGMKQAATRAFKLCTETDETDSGSTRLEYGMVWYGFGMIYVRMAW